MQRGKTLRQALDRIMTIRFPATFQAAFEKLRQQHRHTVKVVPVASEWLNTFNCYAYALSLVDRPRYRALQRAHGDSALVNSIFVTEFLAREELQEIDGAAVAIGTVVFYFADDAVQHGGLVISEPHVIRSKWGPNELYEHALWEVPQSYGNFARYFLSPADPERIIDLLEAHVGR